MSTDMWSFLFQNDVSTILQVIILVPGANWWIWNCTQWIAGNAMPSDRVWTQWHVKKGFYTGREQDKGSKVGGVLAPLSNK